MNVVHLIRLVPTRRVGTPSWRAASADGGFIWFPRSSVGIHTESECETGTDFGVGRSVCIPTQELGNDWQSRVWRML